MVRLEIDTETRTLFVYANLHSSMVRLEIATPSPCPPNCPNLHSSMVRLEISATQDTQPLGQLFTFQYG